MEGTSKVFVLWEPDDEIPARMEFLEEIPAWMDFPEEQEVEKDSRREKLREMCIAWMVAAKYISKLQRRRGLPSSMEIQEENREEEKKREERRRNWGKFSAGEELRAGWKVSEMDRLLEITFLIWRKKSRELDQAYAMRRRLKEAKEKGLQPEEMNENYKDYHAFRNMWMATHSRWGGVFEKITQICSMDYTNEHAPQYVYNHGPPDTLQFFSVKVEGRNDGELCWPLHVFGLVAVRDSIDQHRNLIFNRGRHKCQTLTKEDPYLVLTGPTRVVVANGESIPVTIEAELKVKGTDGSKDKDLIFAAAPLPSDIGSESFDLTGSYSILKIALKHIIACVEGNIFIRVTDGTWPTGFNGQLAAHTSSFNHKKIVLAEFGGDVPVSDNGDVDQSRFVVSVEVFGELVVSYKAWRGDEAMEGEVVFKAEKYGRSYGTLKVGSCILEVLVAWSAIRPVCGELAKW